MDHKEQPIRRDFSAAGVGNREPSHERQLKAALPLIQRIRDELDFENFTTAEVVHEFGALDLKRKDSMNFNGEKYLQAQVGILMRERYIDKRPDGRLTLSPAGMQYAEHGGNVESDEDAIEE